MAVTTIGGQDGGAFPQVSGAEAAAGVSCANDASDDARGMTYGGYLSASRRTFWTFLRHLLKLDNEARVKAHASWLLMRGHEASCSNTACSAFTVPASVRFAPSATARG